MEPLKVEEVYSDINMYLGDYPEKSKLTNSMAVLNGLINLFYTPLRARARRPTFGLTLYNYLQEPITERTAFLMELDIVQAINAWSQRLILDRVQTSVTPRPDLGGFSVRVVGVVLKTNESVDYSLFLRRQG